MGRRKGGGTEISLFPFLSILAALIGALVVIIAGMAIIQMQKADGVTEEELSRDDLNNEVIADITELRGEMDRLRQLLETVSDQQKELAFKMTERNRLKLLQRQLESQDKSVEEMLVKKQTLVDQNAGLLTEHEKIAERITELEELLKKLKIDITTAIPPVKVLPGGSSTNEVPYFIEVNTSTISILRNTEEPIRVARTQLNGPEFKRLLAALDSNPRAKLVFLLRPNRGAIGTYSEAMKVIDAYPFRRTNFRAVKMPLPGNGNLDLSLFYGSN